LVAIGQGVWPFRDYTFVAAQARKNFHFRSQVPAKLDAPEVYPPVTIHYHASARASAMSAASGITVTGALRGTENLHGRIHSSQQIAGGGASR
jgi:hypothetical protein